MKRDTLRLTPLSAWTTGENPTGEIHSGEFFPQRGGIAIPRGGGGGAGAGIKRFRIETVGDDYLVCKAVDEDGSVPPNAALYYIAKPAELRASTYSGIVIGGWSYAVDAGAGTRTATWTLPDGEFLNGLQTVEKCEPGYNAGYNFIFAAQATPNAGVTDPNNASAKLTWLDMNVDARKWMPPRVMVRACINNVSTPIVVRGR